MSDPCNEDLGTFLRNILSPNSAAEFENVNTSFESNVHQNIPYQNDQESPTCNKPSASLNNYDLQPQSSVNNYELQPQSSVNNYDLQPQPIYYSNPNAVSLSNQIPYPQNQNIHASTNNYHAEQDCHSNYATPNVGSDYTIQEIEQLIKKHGCGTSFKNDDELMDILKIIDEENHLFIYYSCISMIFKFLIHLMDSYN